MFDWLTEEMAAGWPWPCLLGATGVLARAELRATLSIGQCVESPAAGGCRLSRWDARRYLPSSNRLSARESLA